MAIDTTRPRKQVAYLGVPWEDAFGYAQAVRVGDAIHVSGQMSHDAQGQRVAPAPLDDDGHPTNFADLEAQVRAIYANAAKVLAQFDATIADVVEETLFVLDVPTAYVAAAKVRASPSPSSLSRSLSGR